MKKEANEKTISKTKKPMPRPDLTSEVAMGFLLNKTIIGVDEVGRGCLAGPVVAGAALLPFDAIKRLKFTPGGRRPNPRAPEPTKKKSKTAQPEVIDTLKQDFELLLEVRDSKLIVEEDRPAIAEAVKRFVQGYAVAEASEREIETLNIHYASHLAMERAVNSLEEKLGIRAHYILVDGNIIPRAFLGRGFALVKGDQKSFSVACAALLAKVYRDELMQKLDEKYPGYGLKDHKGYSTPQHKRQLELLGPCEIHRKSFAGVMEEESDDHLSLLDPALVADAEEFADEGVPQFEG